MQPPSQWQSPSQPFPGSQQPFGQQPTYSPPSPQYPYPPAPTPFTPPGPAPQPPRKPRRRRRVFLIIGAVVAILLIIIVIAAIATPSQPPPQANTTPTTTHATQATKPAATAKPTTVKPTTASSNVIPATHGTPRLGGPLSDFIGAYGQPNGHSSPPDYHFKTVGNIDEYMAMSLGASCSSMKCVASQQIIDISVQSPDQSAGFTPSEAEALCMSYAPSDAHLKQKIAYADGSGFDMVYTSAQLSHAFPASLDAEVWSNGNGGTVAAGTFDVSYLYADNGQGIGSCDMITGEQQTQS